MPSVVLIYRMLIIGIVGAADAWRPVRESCVNKSCIIIIALPPSNALTQSIVRGWILLYVLMTYVDVDKVIDP